jgi:hypothetical protein
VGGNVPTYPARRFGNPVIIQPGIACTAIGLKDAAERREVLARMLAFPVRAEVIQDRRWRRTAERPAVAHVAPQTPGFGAAAAGIEHRHRGVIGIHAVRFLRRAATVMAILEAA